MDFQKLTKNIQTTHNELYTNALKSININLTLRNWLIGYHIVNFEQKGEDKSKYGSNLLAELASKIKIKGLGETNLKNCRKFYFIYPEISQSVTDLLTQNTIRQLTTDFSSVQFKTQNEDASIAYFKQLIYNVSFTHFVELIKIDNNQKRKFYELLIIKTQISVEELKNKISQLNYERISLESNTEIAFKDLEQTIIPENAKDAIKSVYLFDFLNFPIEKTIVESELEENLILQLEKFILELGYGFCFESRQKRIRIDEEYYFVDLVFYHRILKCHVLIELKTDKFKHEHLSQLNSYVGFYKDKMMRNDDNPPIGILLCTEKGNKMVEYALAGLEEKLFVSKYLINLPEEKSLKSFLEKEINKLSKETTHE